jgi:hypothetical protein
MSVSGYKRLAIVLVVLCGLLAFVSVSLFMGYAPLKLRVAFASEQVHIFQEMRIKLFSLTFPLPLAASSTL